MAAKLTELLGAPAAHGLQRSRLGMPQTTAPKPSLAPFLGAAGAIDVRPRRTLVVEGELSPRAYLLLAGRAVLTVRAGEGRDFVVDEYLPGDLFGLEALAGFAAVGTVTTAEASTLKTMELAALERLMLQEPELSLWVTRTLVRRLCIASQRCVELAYGSLEQRILAALDRIAKNFGAYHEMGKMINRPLPCQEIASLVGASRSRVSLAVQDLVRSGHLLRDGTRLVLASRPIAERKRLLAVD